MYCGKATKAQRAPSYCATSYSVLGIPISQLIEPTDRCAVVRSMRCQGWPERDSSCDSLGKRPSPLEFAILHARNILYAGAGKRAQFASPRSTSKGVCTLLM